MIQVNLVPDVKLELIKAQRHRNIVISSAIVIMIASIAVVVMLGVVIGTQAIYQNSLTGQIADKHKEFVEKPDIKKTVTIQNQLTSIQSTHDQKTMSSRIFAMLTEATAQGTDNSITLNSFTLDTGAKTVSVVAQTDKRGFDAAEVFRKNIEGMKVYYRQPQQDNIPNEFLKNPVTTISKNDESQQVASDVVLSDLSYAQNDEDKRRTVSFRLTFTYDPIVFDEKVDLIRFKGLNSGNVTDSYEGIPRALFATPSETSNTGGTR